MNYNLSQKVKLLVFALTFTTLNLAFNFQLQAKDLNLSPAGQLLENDFLKSSGAIVEIQKPLRLYHYLNTAMKDGQLWSTYQKPESRYGDQGQINADLAYSAGTFWDQSNHPTQYVNAGPGMYLAIEPQVSQSYGKSKYIIQFPKSTKFLDVSDPTWKNISKIKMSKQTINELIAEGIISKSSLSKLGMQNGYFTRLSMQYIAAVGFEKYRDMLTKIFERNNITLIQYSWEKTKLNLLCKKASTSAFVYIGNAPSESSTEKARASVPNEIIENTVFDSIFPIAEQLSTEKMTIETTSAFKSALENGNTKSLTQSQIAEIKSVTFNCD